jgi:hypothetical protein
MIKVIAAAAFLAGGLLFAPVANAGTRCDTEQNILGNGNYTTTCDTWGNDGSRSSTTTYCNSRGDCETD